METGGMLDYLGRSDKDKLHFQPAAVESADTEPTDRTEECEAD
jgi:hypothetical protein